MVENSQSFYCVLPRRRHGSTVDCASDEVDVAFVGVVAATVAVAFDGDSTMTPNGNGSLISKLYGSDFFR